MQPNRSAISSGRTLACLAAPKIAGAGDTSHVGVETVGIQQYRPLLALMIKSFKLSNQKILSMRVDDVKAAMHWRVEVHSKITGTTVMTELIDLIEVEDRRIESYVEVFVPCSAP